MTRSVINIAFRWMLFFIILVSLILHPVQVKGATNESQSSTESASLAWKRSDVWAGDMVGPVDGAGHHWQEPGFDDSAWRNVTFPDSGGSTTMPADRYYRTHFTWDGSAAAVLRFASDDGLSIYVNGQLLGTWGNGWRTVGCVNFPVFTNCNQGVTVPPLIIPSKLLHLGDNVLAIDLWDGAVTYWGLDAVLETMPRGSWYGEYFNNPTLSGPPDWTETTSKIDFAWALFPDTNEPPKIKKDYFSVRWTRVENFSKEGLYRFRKLSDDGMRVYLDGEEIIDDWKDQSFSELTATRQVTQGDHLLTVEYYDAVLDGFAYFGWYLCPNGAGDCSLNIGSVYQNSPANQNLAMPTGCTNLNHQTFANYGCMVTSIVMALKNVGVTTTQTEFNDWLSKNGGYTGGNCTGDFSSPDNIKKFAKTKGVDIDVIQEDISDVAKVIRDKKQPVIMKLPGHYVLAIDVAEKDGVQTFGINDPWVGGGCKNVPNNPGDLYSTPGTHLVCGRTLSHYITISDRGTTPIPYAYLAPSALPKTTSVTVNVTGGEALLTDSAGHRLGYDPSSQTIRKEFAGSIYLDAGIIPDGGDTSAMLIRQLYIPGNAPTFFTVVITSLKSVFELQSAQSTSAEPVRVQVVTNDANFNTQTTTFMAEPNKPYIVQFTPGEPFQVGNNSSIYLPLMQR